MQGSRRTEVAAEEAVGRVNSRFQVVRRGFARQMGQVGPAIGLRSTPSVETVEGVPVSLVIKAASGIGLCPPVALALGFLSAGVRGAGVRACVGRHG